MFRFERRIERHAEGGFAIRLSGEERDVLRSLIGQLRDLVTTDDEDDPANQRLFPAAYTEDPIRDADYQEIMRPELRDHRLAALDRMEASVGKDRLSEDELVAWMGSVNDLRLVLGTRLDVTEELYELDDPFPPDDARAAAYGLFGYLGVLLEEMVEALAGDLR